jgi:hypothetical protein
MHTWICTHISVGGWANAARALTERYAYEVFTNYTVRIFSLKNVTETSAGRNGNLIRTLEPDLIRGRLGGWALMAVTTNSYPAFLKTVRKRALRYRYSTVLWNGNSLCVTDTLSVRYNRNLIRFLILSAGG